MKICATCNRKFPDEKFNRDKNFPDGRKRTCRTCVRWHIIWNKYRLREEQYVNLLEEQEGCCAICGLEAAEDVPLQVDHDHTTGRIRGLLCGPCNRGLGMLQDSCTILKAAIQYLESPDSVTVKEHSSE